MNSLQHSEQKRKKKMELNEQQKEEIVLKLGILSHLLKSAAQIMQDIVAIAENVKEEEIEKLITEHADKGMEMINKFLEEMKDIE